MNALLKESQHEIKNDSNICDLYYYTDQKLKQGIVKKGKWRGKKDI
jgi:gamma-glutamylcyclotransferase (GGCT)/AIG2-like uncharacterized protein YtfP